MSGGRPVIVMGVSGSGKTTVGTRVAQELGVAFIDGDALHPVANKEKMAAGRALDDADRYPWLARIGAELAEATANGRPVVIACSALRRSYRDALRAAEPTTRFVYLKGDGPLIGERMAQRHHEFMPASLLQTQLETLEPPGPDEEAITVDIGQDLDLVVEAVTALLQAD
ncbi:gluconokinase [Paeniglutamicibacter cryotolerans]|uniref:Gluconokinase n=1 Tax=Paeniglutamicibacter cryotolerans TaxID=670079 RepID=A0A839QJI9_9MICC|nr:gluconokinase [Paeniglutamicibacter cryotolerans]MBB2994705.1 gluconokinase [Paeniglutamicibacter cryotolerans]